MRHFAVVLTTIAALVAGPAVAADLPQYVPPSAPAVDTGLGGAFYLRGSAAFNNYWAGHYTCDVGPCGSGGATSETLGFNQAGYGYSLGVGAGYEFGNGLRVDGTIDYLSADHLIATHPDVLSSLDLSLRSTLALANVYYDFGLGSMGLGNGGFGAYVGAGAGAAFNEISDHAPPPGTAPTGNSTTVAGALMAGVTYDMGSVVADLGWRGIYLPTMTNAAASNPLVVNDTWINEVRGTLRYRFD